jgi:Cof subfamily protein (haloacid dehalogenase superfamily)
MSRPPIRLMISDVDGTLVRKDKTVSDATVEAVERLRAAGVKFTVVSARPLTGVLSILQRLGVEEPVGAYNGGTIAKPDGTVLSAERLDAATARDALARFDLDWVVTWVFADGKWHAKTTDTPHDASEIVTAAQQPTVVESFDDLVDRIDKIVAVSDDEPRLAALEAQTQVALKGRATVARSQTYYLDVTAPDANKGHGVTELARALGVPLEQTAVIGDGQNDVYMFKVAGLSIAVDNASDEVKTAADHVTASNMNDGVAKAIDRYVLPAAKGDFAA